MPQILVRSNKTMKQGHYIVPTPPPPPPPSKVALFRGGGGGVRIAEETNSLTSP